MEKINKGEYYSTAGAVGGTEGQVQGHVTTIGLGGMVTTLLSTSVCTVVSVP